ncbi:hypothetical protein ACH4MA_03885 [Streptomyces roseolus]|uniref:hypothetical protein n=1 Tax=Streptomyces roseolus TaxID=67358 RepID=UPI0037BAAF7A
MDEGLDQPGRRLPWETAMGTLTIPATEVHRLLDDSTRPTPSSCQRAFTGIAATRRGRPTAEVLPLLHAVADTALLGLTPADLAEQADAISRGVRYELRVRATGR